MVSCTAVFIVEKTKTGIPVRISQLPTGIYYRPYCGARQIARYQRQKLGMIKNSCGQEHIGKVHG